MPQPRDAKSFNYAQARVDTDARVCHNDISEVFQFDCFRKVIDQFVRLVSSITLATMFMSIQEGSQAPFT